MRGSAESWAEMVTTSHREQCLPGGIAHRILFCKTLVLRSHVSPRIRGRCLESGRSVVAKGKRRKSKLSQYPNRDNAEKQTCPSHDAHP